MCELGLQVIRRPTRAENNKGRSGHFILDHTHAAANCRNVWWIYE